MVRRLDHEKAIELRMTGKSYNEIAKDLDVGKSCLSYWLRNLELPSETVKILENKSNYPKEKFAEYNRQKHERVQAENKEIIKSFSKKIKPITDYDLLLLGASLYWGEGYKRHSRGCGEHVSFCNSDPDMIKIFLRFTREILKVPEEKIKPTVQIHLNVSREKAISFWSKVADISSDKFHIIYQVSRASKGKRPKNSLPFGTLYIRIANRQRFFEIMGLIDGLIKQTLK